MITKASPIAPIAYCFTILLATSNAIRADESWERIVSNDGKASALAPGKPEMSKNVRKTLGGNLVTYSARYETDSVNFTITETSIPPAVLKFVGEKKMIENAKGKLLDRAMAREDSFEPHTVSGKKGMLLRYQKVHHTDPVHRGYHGYALILIHEGTLYLCNGVVKKDDGLEEINKFADSIRIDS